VCGIFTTIGNEPKKSDVTKALYSLKHRGPDSTGAVSYSNITLGMNRLILRGELEDIPFEDPSKNWVTAYNGEIYTTNIVDKSLYPRSPYDEIQTLKFDLFDHQYHSDGMYAAAIHDINLDETFIARDQFAIKPLFYKHGVEYSVVTSEIRAIPLESPLELSPDSAVDTLLFGKPLNRKTSYEGVYEVPEGLNKIRQTETGLTFESRQLNDKWEKANPDHIARYVSNSIEACCYTHRRVGLALSGGFDSAIIACELNRLGLTDVTIFSLILPNNKDGISCLDYLELPKPGPWQNWKLVKIEVGPYEYKNLMKQSALAMNGQHRMTSAPLVMAISNAAREHGITMMLTGEGPDEFYFGYSGHSKLLHNGVEDDKSLEGFYHKYLDHLSNPQIRNSLSSILPQECIKNSIDDFRHSISQLKGNNFLNLLVEAEIEYSLKPLLWRTDHCFMANAIEARMPFLHDAIPSVARKLSRSKSVNDVINKRWLRQSLRALAPENIVNKEKIAFRAPFNYWLANELEDWSFSRLEYYRKELLELNIKLPNESAVKDFFMRHQSSALLFSLLNLTFLIEGR